MPFSIYTNDNEYLHNEILERDSGGLEEQYEILDEQCDTIEEKYNALEKRCNVKEEQYTVLQDHYNVLEGQYNVLEGQYNVLEGQYNVQEEQYSYLEEDRDKLEEDNEALHQQNQALRVLLEYAQTDANEQQQRAEEQQCALNKKLDEQHEATRASLEDFEDLEAVHQQLNEQYYNLHTRYNLGLQTLGEAVIHHNVFRNEIADLQSRLGQHENHHIRLNTWADQLEGVSWALLDQWNMLWIARDEYDTLWAAFGEACVYGRTPERELEAGCERELELRRAEYRERRDYLRVWASQME